MNFVDDDWKPHASHVMTEWHSTILSMASNDRFGDIRECQNCHGEEARAGGAGSHVRHYELDFLCCVSQVNAEWEEAFEKHFEPSNFSTPALKAAVAEVFRAGWNAAELQRAIALEAKLEIATERAEQLKEALKSTANAEGNALERAETAERVAERNAEKAGLLDIVADWRLDKAIEHFGELLAVSRSLGREPNPILYRYQGWLLMLKDSIGALTTPAPTETEMK